MLPLLIQAQSPDPEARRDAAVQLAAVPAVWSHKQLVAMLRDAYGSVREAAKDSLQQVE